MQFDLKITSNLYSRNISNFENKITLPFVYSELWFDEKIAEVEKSIVFTENIQDFAKSRIF